MIFPVRTAVEARSPPRLTGVTMFHSKSIRRAITLLELIAVIAIMAIFVAVAASRIGPETIRDFSARADARRLAADILHARRRSIATGENHYLNFTVKQGRVIGYTLCRQGNVAVDEPREFAAGVVVSTSAPKAKFTFEGTALAAYQIVLTGPGQTWQVDVVPATGTAVVTQTAP
jgi:prepilin-type N-terminal cleavage/methylation domain-containing protein